LGAKAALPGTLELSTNELNTITAGLLRWEECLMLAISISVGRDCAGQCDDSFVVHVFGGSYSGCRRNISVPQLAVRAGANVVLAYGANSASPISLPQ